MELEAGRQPTRGEVISSTTAKEHEGIEGLTWAELSAKWSEVVQALEEGRVTVVNPDHALEGALLIRYDKPLYGFRCEIVAWIPQVHAFPTAWLGVHVSSHCVNRTVGNTLVFFRVS